MNLYFYASVANYISFKAWLCIAGSENIWV